MMKKNLILTRLGGVINLLTAVLHLTFWEEFDWNQELSELNIVNRNIMQMLNGVVAFPKYHLRQSKISLILTMVNLCAPFVTNHSM